MKFTVIRDKEKHPILTAEKPKLSNVWNIDRKICK